MAGGRPTKYSNAVIDQLKDYIANYETYGDIVPSAAGFACVLEVSRHTLYNWAEKHAAFLHMLGRLNSAQERIAMKKGLLSEWNPTIVKLLLAKHGYTDKQEITGAESGPLEVVYRVVHANRSEDQ